MRPKSGQLLAGDTVSFVVVGDLWGWFTGEMTIDRGSKIRVVKPPDEGDVGVIGAKGCGLYTVTAVAFQELQVASGFIVRVDHGDMRVITSKQGDVTGPRGKIL